MGTIRKRERKARTVYCAEIRLAGHPSTSKTFHSRKQARRWISHTEADLSRKSLEPHQYTLTEGIEHYLQNPLPGTEETVADNAWKLRYWEEKLGTSLLVEITPALIYQHREELLNTPRRVHRAESKEKIYKPATVNRHVAALSAVLNRSVQQGWINSNPARLVRRLQENNQRNRVLKSNEIDEIDELLKHAQVSKNRDVYDYVVLALCSGARKSELENLLWENVDFEQGSITFKNTKNGEDKTIPCVKIIKEILKKRYSRRQAESRHVFTRIKSGGIINVRRSYINAVKKAGIEDFTFHDLRHTATSFLANQKINTLQIARILGHKSIQTTMRYSHLDTNDLKKALE